MVQCICCILSICLHVRIKLQVLAIFGVFLLLLQFFFFFIRHQSGTVVAVIGTCCWSASSAVAQVWSASFASPCAWYSVSWWPLSLFSLWISLLPHPSPPPFIFPLINQCDRCLVPLAWGLMAGRRGFTSHAGACLCLGADFAKSGTPGHPGNPHPLNHAVVYN